MRRFSLGTILLSLLALYFIMIAFIPNLSDFLNFNLIAMAFFFFLAWQQKSFIPGAIGLAILSNYLHDLAHLNYSKTSLFVGIVLIGVVLNHLFRPSLGKYRKIYSEEFKDYQASHHYGHEREVSARSFFSEDHVHVSSQNLDIVYVEANFGESTIDLRQAQFMTNRPEIKVHVSFGSAKIRIPEHWEVVPKNFSKTFAEFKNIRPHSADSKGDIQTIILSGSIFCGELDIYH